MGIFVALTVLGLMLGLLQWIDSRSEPAWRLLIAIGLALTWLGAALSGLLLAVSGRLGIGAGLRDGATGSPTTPLPTAPGAGAPPAEVMDAVIAGLPTLGGWLLVASLLALLLLLPPVRRALARVMPIDPERMVHVVALQLSFLVVVGSVFVAQFIGAVLAADDSEGAMRWLEMANEESSTLSGIWAQQLGFALLAMLGVGLFFVRGPRVTLDRLGLIGRVSLKWWAAAVLLGLGGAVLVSQLWKLWDPASQAGIEAISEALFGPFIRTGLLGALTIGLSAGIGEETLFRGALQPRLGIVYTSLLFAVVHTQYGVSPALLQVLGLALIMGIVRQRANTLTAVAAHATYNFLLVIFAMVEAGIPLQGLPPGATPEPKISPTPAAAAAPDRMARLDVMYPPVIYPR